MTSVTPQTRLTGRQLSLQLHYFTTKSQSNGQKTGHTCVEWFALYPFPTNNFLSWGNYFLIPEIICTKCTCKASQISLKDYGVQNTSWPSKVCNKAWGKLEGYPSGFITMQPRQKTEDRRPNWFIVCFPDTFWRGQKFKSGYSPLPEKAEHLDQSAWPQKCQMECTLFLVMVIPDDWQVWS